MNYCYFDSPIGILTLAENDGALVGLRFGKKPAGENRETELVKKVKTELNEYFAGERMSFDFPIDFITGTEFQRKAWKFLLTVPYGTSAAYGDVAAAAGNIKAVRAAGNAVGKNPIAIVVPCHRILAKGGALGGFTGGIEKKKFLLALEKITFKR